MVVVDTKALRGCTSVIPMQIGKSNILENPLSPGEPPQMGGTREENIVLSILYGNADTALTLEEILTKQTKDKINNMHAPGVCSDTWKCTSCRKMGIRINKHIGRCTTQGCLGVSTQTTLKELGRKKRKMETLIMDKRPTVGGITHTFWTDGPGIKIKGTEGLLMTGWATVRCEIIKRENSKTPITIKKVETWRGGGMDLETVARCETEQY